MEFKREIIIDKSIEEVWKIVGTQFGDAHIWASGINHSNSYGKPKLTDCHCNNRSCELPNGKITEVIRIFDPSNHVLEYEVIEGFPFFVDSGINNWKLFTVGNQTKVVMHLVIKTKGLIGTIMNPMMKIQMNGATNSVLVDLKHYVETGNPSPKKHKEILKLSKKAA